MRGRGGGGGGGYKSLLNSTPAKNDLITPGRNHNVIFFRFFRQIFSQSCEQRKANGGPCNYPALNGKRFAFTTRQWAHRPSTSTSEAKDRLWSVLRVF